MDLDPTLLQKIAKESGTSLKQVDATLDLLEKQAAIPFIARYRKEVTANLDEPKIRRIAECYGRYQEFLKRRRSILARIENQGKLTEELKETIQGCYDKNRLEDLYCPFKPKGSTEASAAKEKGLEPLAKQLWEQGSSESSIDDTAQKYLSEDKAVATREEAIQGALAIVAEWLAEHAVIRGSLRQLMSSEGVVVSKVVEGKAGEKTKYDSFYDFREEVSRIPFHRIAALRRGVRERILTLEIDMDDNRALQVIREKVIRQADSPYAPHLEKAIQAAYFHPLKPLLQGEIRSNLKERTDNEALKLFQANLSNLLLAPPVGSVPVMGIDPGARSACRIAVIDASGAYREHATLGPGLPRKNSDRAEAILYRLIQRHGTRAIAIGNGVGSRDIDRFVKGFLAKYHAGHSFDLSLVRGKAAKSDPPTDKEGKTNGRTASEPSIPGGASRTLETKAVEEPNPARQDSPATADQEEAGAESDQARQKSEADPDRGSATAHPSSEETSISTVSEPAAGMESTAAENGDESGRTDSATPTESGTLTAIEPSPTPTPSNQADPETGQSQRQPIFSAIVHKGGTGAYASSEGARKEFPRLDLGVRGAISIARRLQDPLVELAKIQPKAIILGPKSQEVEQKRLKQKLHGILESCINHVGVDLNRAPVELLGYVAGLNARLARNIVEFRQRNGSFSSRSQLMEVPGFTDTCFEQSAGFLRVQGSAQPLDRTTIHPERYGLVEEMARSVQATVGELIENPKKLEEADLEKLSGDRVGLPTLQHIRRELSQPGRDPRKVFVPPSFRDDIKELSDLHKGMLVEGTVSNVTSFGAFVDIGVQQEGLVHISEISSRFVQDANQAIHVGQVVKAKVIGVDTSTNRISLSIKALRVSENPGRHKKKMPPKTDSRLAFPKPADASSRESATRQIKRSTGKSEQKPIGRRRGQGKKYQATGVKTIAIQRKQSKPFKAEVFPDTSNLSFSEKIRLLQEKFSGIR